MCAVPPAEIARALDCPVELVAHLPELLEGLDSLGCDPERLCRILDDAHVPRDIAALDLGCGKGAFSVALAERGHAVTGIEAFAPFVDSARALARRRGFADRCVFRLGDLREASRDAGCGLVALISVGRPFGTLVETVQALVEMVSPGGWILIEDSYRAAPTPGFEEYATLAETIAQMRAIPDVEAVRIEHDEPGLLDAHEKSLREAMAQRGEAIIARDPSKAPLVRQFLDMQRKMALLYERDLPGILFLLRRRY